MQAIIGPNGSGKTTLLNALSGASHADAGSIRIDGQGIFRLRPNRIARLGLARTFQNIRVFSNLTVLENVKVAAACNTPMSMLNIMLSIGNSGNARRRSRVPREKRWTSSASPNARTIARPNCLMRSNACWKSPAHWLRSPACCCWTSPLPA